MTFAEADLQYRELKQQFDAGRLDEAAFEEAIRDLMLQDEQGRWWAKARDTGQWNYYDAVTQNWVPASPPTQAPPPPPSYTTGRAVEPITVEPAAVEPASVESTYGAGAAYQPQVVQPSAQAFSAASFRAGQPELSPGLKVIFYILSFLVPIVGIVLYFVYRGKPAMEDRSAARRFLIHGVISFDLSSFCGFVLPLMLFPFSV